MKILTAAEMRRIDRLTSESFGVPSLTLMENAGRGVVEVLEERFAPLGEQKIVVVCGRGSNGGDGFVAARMLFERGLSPRVLLLADPGAVKGDAAVNLERLTKFAALEAVRDSEAWQRVRDTLAGATLLVDAILGTGLGKPLEGFLREAVRDLDALRPRPHVVAVDLPTGLSADTGQRIGDCLPADVSVTFTAPKLAHVFPPACEAVGDWIVKPIGTPREALENDPALWLNLTAPADLTWLRRPRRADSHKGSFGHVLVVAGSVGKSGAAALCAKAALRAGAGLVTVATPRSVLPVVASLGLEFMTEPLPETGAGTLALAAFDGGSLDRLVEGKTVLAVGPGVSTFPETSECVRRMVKRYALPCVLDADGLNSFEGRPGDLRAEGRVRVLTPHPGEMARLAGLTTAQVQADRLGVARRFAAEHGVCVVLKGYRSLTVGPDGQTWVNPTGNPGMATGGTGDVLTGLTAGLLAQHSGHRVVEVVAAAVYWHGLAGDIAARDRGQVPMIAGDLLEALPEAYEMIITGD